MNANTLAGQLEQKRAELKSLFDSHKNDKGELNMPADCLVEVENRNAELKTLTEQYQAAKSAEVAESENQKALDALKTVNRLPMADANEPKPPTKSLGELIVESGALKTFNAPQEVDFSVKTVMSTGAGYAPWSPRDNVVSPYPVRPLSLLDVIPSMNWDYAAYSFMRETTFTNNAAEKAESVEGTLAAYGEGALAFTEVTVTNRDIGTFLPVTDQQLEDVPGMVDILNNRLSYQVRARFEGQLLSGNGTPPNIEGITVVSGIQTQAKGSDDVATAILKGIGKVRANAFAEPTAILIHPNDYTDLRALQASTGQWLFDGGMNFAGVPMLWGVPVVISAACTENTAVVVDLSYYSAIVRRGATVELDRMGNDFKNGMKTVRATLRGCLAAYRPSAACKVTGI